MKKYYIKLLFPSSNKRNTNQYEIIIIDNARMDYDNSKEFYRFYNNTGKTIALYPIHYTIISNIEFKDKENENEIE